ncbi:FAD dependent oxidoreductase [Paramyrothecium foliicola]|nr:FAD dependent oxidoreductase [Paramyrothecium foliicola]
MLNCGMGWDNKTSGDDNGDPGDENYGEADTICPSRRSSTSSRTTTTRRTSTTRDELEQPTETPLEESSSMDKIRHCEKQHAWIVVDMAGLLDSYSDRTCSHHNALRDIPVGMYACGVTFRFKSSDGPSAFQDSYGVVSLQQCCDKANATLMRIPGNTGCEMQFCSVSAATSTRTFDYHSLVPQTLSNGVQTYSYADPVPSTETRVEAPGDVMNCMAFVYEGDLPDAVAERVFDAGNWCAVRMYDTEMPESEVREPKAASPAPAAWTEAAKAPFDANFSSLSAGATVTGTDASRNTGVTEESVGGGTFGTSTAYHLAKRGFKSITILDRWAVPSNESAGNDINKIVRTEYPDPLYAALAQEAVDIWKDEQGLFAGLYHKTGWALISSSQATLPFITESMEMQRRLGLPSSEPITTNEMHQRWPAITGDMNGWLPHWNPETAWVNAVAALKCMAMAAMEMGVKYVSGSAGHVSDLLYDESSRCIGARAANGATYSAEHVILAAGAAAPGLLDLEGQIVSKGHTVIHIQLNADDVAKYKALPVIDHLDGCIFFPPQEDGIIKITANIFVTNFAPSHPHISIPRCAPPLLVSKLDSSHHAWVSELIWGLAYNRDGDMPDEGFLIANVPARKNLMVALGGSAHGFKFLPIIGKYVADMIEGKLKPEIAERWKWRPNSQSSVPMPFAEPVQDLNGFPGWEPKAELQ